MQECLSLEFRVCAGLLVFEKWKIKEPKFIISFRRSVIGKSRLVDIDAGLEALRAEKRGIQSVAISPLDSGLGGLQLGPTRNQGLKRH